MVFGFGQARRASSSSGQVEYIPVNDTTEKPAIAMPPGWPVADPVELAAVEKRREAGHPATGKRSARLEDTRQIGQPPGIGKPGTLSEPHEVAGKALALPEFSRQRQARKLTAGMKCHAHSADRFFE